MFFYLLFVWAYVVVFIVHLNSMKTVTTHIWDPGRVGLSLPYRSASPKDGWGHFRSPIGIYLGRLKQLEWDNTNINSY